MSNFDLIWVVPSMETLGGSEYAAVTFMKLLVAAGHRVRLMTGRDLHPAWRERLSHASVGRLEIIEASDNTPSGICALIANLHAQQAADLIQFMPIEEHCLEWLRLRQRLSVPIAAWEPTDMSARCWWLPKALHELIHEVDLLLVLNPDAEQHARKLYGYRGEIQLVPNTLISAVDHVPRREPSTEPVIGCISRLSLEKGIEYLLAAFSLVLSQIPKARLALWGWGERADEERLDLLCKMFGIDAQVDFKGSFEPFHGIDAVAAGADVFVLSSLFEGAPIALLELAARARPLAATATAGARWICGEDYTWLTPIGDTGKLAESLISLLRSQESRQAAATALQTRVETHFSNDVAAATLCAAYSRVIGKKAVQ
jgi:glycosyltransferase involved in cell wall biosynthesis